MNRITNPTPEMLEGHMSIADDHGHDDGHGHDGKAKIIKGKVVLTKDSKTQKWSYRIGKGRDIGTKNNNLTLEFRRNNFRVIYVGNLPLSEEQVKKPSKRNVKA